MCASGNRESDTDAELPESPAGSTSPGCIAVNASDGQGALTDFSGHGAMTTDLAAPGDAILSTVPAAYGTADAPTPDSLIVQDGFESDPGLFSYAAHGPGAATVEREDGGQAGQGAGGHRIRWDVAQAQAGQEESLVLSTRPGAAKAAAHQAGKRLEDARGLSLDMSYRDSAATGEGRTVHVFLASTSKDDPWVEISSPGFSPDYARWTTQTATIPDRVKASIDWDNLAVKITCTPYPADDGRDLSFLIDNVSLSEPIPYAYASGTSMAAPMVSGAVAALAAAYPDDTPDRRRARLLGSTRPTDKLRGTCTTDGILDLSASARPRPVVDLVSQDPADPSAIRILGAAFGDAPGTLAIEGVGDVPISSWDDGAISATLSAGLHEDLRYVEVARGDDPRQTGRRLVRMAGTAEEPGADLFEKLPAPDMEALVGRPLAQISVPLEMAAADGKLFAAIPFLDGGVDFPDTTATALLAFDPVAGAWSVAHVFDRGTLDEPLICANGGTVYLFDAAGARLYAFDAAAGSLEEKADYRPFFDGLRRTSLRWANLACDGTRLLLMGCVDADTLQALQTTYEIDLSTFSIGEGPPLPEQRQFARAENVGGSLLIASGGTFQLALSYEAMRLDGNDYTAVAPLRRALRLFQMPIAATGALPAGAEVTRVDGSTLALPAPSMIVTALATDDQAGRDTYVYDARAGAWVQLMQRSSPVRLMFAAGAVTDDAFYVLGFDSSGSDENKAGLELRRLSFKPPNP